MRIAHIQYSFAPENGGPTRSLTNYCLGQAAAGHAVSLWTVEGYPQWSPALRLPPPVEMHVCPVAPPVRLGCSPELRRELRRAESPDIYHLHGLWLQAMRYGADEARRRQVPYLLELAGMYEPLGLRNNRLPKRIARWWYQDRILHGAACLHVNSQQEAENIRKLGFKTPIAVVPVGVDLGEIEKLKAEIGAQTRHLTPTLSPDEAERELKREIRKAEMGKTEREEQIRHLTPFLSPGEAERELKTESGAQTRHLTPALSPNEAERELKAEGSRPFVLYLSRLHPKKGLDLLIRSWASIRKAEMLKAEMGATSSGLRPPSPQSGEGEESGKRKADEWRLVIAGSGVPEYVNECRALAARLGIADQCLWLGHVDEAEKSWLFAHAYCYVLPTSSENFGNTVAEALAHGTPVITTIHTPWKDLAAHGCGWQVDNTEEEISRALRESFGLDDATRARMGDAGRRLIRDRYSLEAVLREINAVYEWLLGRAPAPACVEFSPAREREGNVPATAVDVSSASEATVRIEGHKEVEALFDQKAATWSSKYGPNGSLRWRLHAFEEHLTELVKPPAAVLDFGCGTGNLACHLSDRGYALSACDLSARMIEWAKKNNPDKPVNWHTLPIGWPSLPFAAGQFDAIVASSVLEYLPVLKFPLGEFHRILKPGGHLIATVPNIRHSSRKIEKGLRPAVFAASRMPWLSRNPRLKSYATYLHCSVNRMPLEVWHAVGRQAGLEPVTGDGNPASTAALVFLAFRKPNGNPGGK